MEGEVIAFEALAVNGSVVALSPDVYAPPDSPQGARALITAEGGDMRYRVDGQDPEPQTGHILSDGDVLEIKSIYSIRKFRAINVSVAGKLSVSYES